MELLSVKNLSFKMTPIYKNIRSILLLFVIAVTIGAMVVYFPSYLKWLLATLVLIGLIIFAFRFPFHSFLLFIITLPLEAAFVFEVGFTIHPSYILLIIIILGLFFSGRKLHFKSTLNIPTFVFLGISTLSLLMTIFSPPPEVTLAEVMKYRSSEIRSIIQLLFLFFFVSAYFLTIHFCSERKKLNTVLKTYIGIASLIAIYGIYQFFAVKFSLPFIDITSAISTSGVGRGVSYYAEPSLFRSHATFQEPLFFGNYILSVFPLLLILSFFKYKKNILTKNALLIKSNLFLVFIFATALLLTKSRGAWLGFIGAILLLFFFSKIKFKIKLIGITIFILIFISILIIPFVSYQYSNLGEFISPRFSSEILSQEPRLLGLSFVLDLWKQYPILGVGLGNYGFYAAQHFHSPLIVSGAGRWLQALVETGILGFAAFIWLIFTYYKILIRALRKARNTSWYPYFLGYLACFTAMIVQYFFSFDRFPLYFWVFLGISIATVKLINKSEKNSLEL